MKTVLISAATTLLTYLLITFPPIIFLYIWLAIGLYSNKLDEDINTYKDCPIFIHCLGGPITLIVWICANHYQIKFQSPIAENED